MDVVHRGRLFAGKDLFVRYPHQAADTAATIPKNLGYTSWLAKAPAVAATRAAMVVALSRFSFNFFKPFKYFLDFIKY